MCVMLQEAEGSGAGETTGEGETGSHYSPRPGNPESAIYIAGGLFSTIYYIHIPYVKFLENRSILY